MVAGRGTRRLSVAALALAVGWVGFGVPTFAADQSAANPRACLVVDTDAGLDDYRALAILLPE